MSIDDAEGNTDSKTLRSIDLHLRDINRNLQYVWNLLITLVIVSVIGALIAALR